MQLVFSINWLQETKGKSLEEIEKYWKYGELTAIQRILFFVSTRIFSSDMATRIQLEGFSNVAFIRKIQLELKPIN